jgi:hypothetical protein
MKKTSASPVGSTSKKDSTPNTPNKAVRQFTGTGTKALGSDLRKFEEWYDLETLHFLTLTVQPNLLAFKYIFIAEETFKTNFIAQFKALNVLRKNLRKVAYFISYEPAEMNTSHFIFGVIIENKLLIINPLGTYDKEGYTKVIPAAITDQGIEKIYYCTTPLQRDPGKKLVSCGPICASLLTHISSLAPSKIIDFLNNKGKQTKGSFYTIALSDEFIPSELKPLISINDESTYTNQLTSLRASHLQQLTHLTLVDESCIYFSNEQNLMLKIIQNQYTIIPEISEYTSLLVTADYFEAVKNGNIEKVSACLAKNPALLNQVDLQGYSALNLATLKANVPMAEYLLARGISLDIGGPVHKSAEEYANFCNIPEIFKLIDTKRKATQVKLSILPTFTSPIFTPPPGELKLQQTPRLSVVVAPKQKGDKQTPTRKLGVNRLFRLDEGRFINNIDNITYLKEIIQKLSTAKNPHEQAIYILEFYRLLMNIPYKYGRSNIEKSQKGKWEDAIYLLKIGLPNLVKELTTHKILPEILLTRELIAELCVELPIALANFEQFQLQETVLDNNGNLRPGNSILQEEIKQLKDKIERLKATRYTSEKKAELKNRIVELNFASQQIEKLILLFTKYQHETDIALSALTKTQLENFILTLERTVKILEKISERLKQNANQSLHADDKRTLNRLSKEINIILPECNTIKAAINEILEYNKLLLQLANKNSDERQIFLGQKKSELQDLKEKLNFAKELLGIANAKSSQQIKEEINEVKIQLDNIYRDIKTSEQTIADAKSSIIQIEKHYAVSANIPYYQWKAIETQFSKLRQEGNKLSKDKEANQEALKKVTAEMEPLKNKLKDYVNDEKIKFHRNEIENHTKNIRALNKKQTSTREHLDQLNNELTKSISAEKSYDDRKTLEEQLLQAESRLKEIYEANSNLTKVKFTQLKKYQVNYSKKYIKEIVKGFYRNLFCANSNIAIISAIVDFVAWQKEYCDDEMKLKIEIILPETYLKDFRGFRNKGMHSLDDITRLEFAMADTTTPHLWQAKNLLLSMLSYLLIPKHMEFLEGKTITDPIIIESYPVTFTIPPSSVDTCLKPLQGKQLEDGTDAVFTSEEQLAILKSSIANSKAILNTFANELKKDTLIKREGHNNLTYSLETIIKIMCTADTDLSDKDIGIKLKYDALLQALGQAMGNLQQFTILTDFGKIDIENLENLINLNRTVPLVKDYRSSRTHNGYYNAILLEKALTAIANTFGVLASEIDILYNAVKNAYYKIDYLQPIGFDTIYTENGALRLTHCKLS